MALNGAKVTAYKQYVSIVQWYSLNVGKQAASSFVKSVMYANEQMLKYPTIVINK